MTLPGFPFLFVFSRSLQFPSVAHALSPLQLSEVHTDECTQLLLLYTTTQHIQK